MNAKLYEMMDWAQIEAIVYSEEDNPHEILGAHVTEKGVLIQTFIPTAKEIVVRVKGVKKEYCMEEADEAGFYAVLIPGKKIPDYSYRVTYDNGTQREYKDPYVYKTLITEKEQKKFAAGIWYDCYEKLGAHPMEVDGISGVYFAVWAPNAVRVSLVGDFVLWDGRRLPMRRLGTSGIFDLFVPGLSAGILYKYEIKAKGDRTFLKADPYANATERSYEAASVVAGLNEFKWTDAAFEQRHMKKTDPMIIYEMHLGMWKRKSDDEVYTYMELAPMVAEYIKEMGYTHVELMPVMEYSDDTSLGYRTSGYYAPTSRYGSPQEFMYFVNYLHTQDIGVILDWTPACFASDDFGMGQFDGTCLYEHLDPRQGVHPQDGTLLYNYARPEVTNFLIANALFWSKKYHVDGIRFASAALMLYLDYGRQDGEWVANLYGGNENLDAIEFLKHLNSIYKQKFPNKLLIAEETSGWPQLTTPVEAGGLGFDYKWNTEWRNDFLNYMLLDSAFRSGAHNDLIFSMIYAYSDDFILSLPQLDNLRVAYGYMMVHPGKKMFSMGQETQPDYIKALNAFYHEHSALYRMDHDPDGFEWINSISANENILVFLRKTKKKDELLLVVCNFSPQAYENYKIGVPHSGKYKEIFNSDRVEFGGSGVVNPRLKQSKKDECDDRTDSITIKVPPMAVSIFSYTKSEKISGSKKAGKKNLKAELEEKYIKARNER